MLRVVPENVVFARVVLHKAYVRHVELENTSSTEVTVAVRPSAPARYRVTPTEVVLAPGGKASLAVCVCVRACVRGVA